MPIHIFPYLFSIGPWTYVSESNRVARSHMILRVPLVPSIPQDDTSSAERIFTSYFVIPTFAVDLPPFDVSLLVRCKRCKRFHISWQIGDAFYDEIYIRKIRDNLRDVYFPTLPRTNAPTFFTFNGGQGILMPLIEKHENNRKIIGAPE